MLKWKQHLHGVLGFSAGAVIGVALFDLLPEAASLTARQYPLLTTTALIALGFFLYMALHQATHLRSHSEHPPSVVHTRRSVLGAGSLTLHSLLDGIGIGLAFKVSTAVGLIVAVGVLVHDFSDGINTVSLVMRNQGTDRQAHVWLSADALAPLLGVLATHFFTLSHTHLGMVLALFCGFFLYIGACDLLPESYRQRPRFTTILLTLLGALTLYMAVRLSG